MLLDGVWAHEELDTYLDQMWLSSLVQLTTLTWFAEPTNLLWKATSGILVKQSSLFGQLQIIVTGRKILCT